MEKLKEQLMIQSLSHSVKHGSGSNMARVGNRTGSMVLFDCCKMNSEVYKAIISFYVLQKYTKTDDNDSKLNSRKEMEYLKAFKLKRAQCSVTVN